MFGSQNEIYHSLHKIDLLKWNMKKTYDLIYLLIKKIYYIETLLIVKILFRNVTSKFKNLLLKKEESKLKTLFIFH